MSPPIRWWPEGSVPRSETQDQVCPLVSSCSSGSQSGCPQDEQPWLALRVMPILPAGQQPWAVGRTRVCKSFYKVKQGLGPASILLGLFTTSTSSSVRPSGMSG